MMKAADLRNWNDVASLRRLNRAGCRRISIKRKVRAGLVIICEVIRQDVHEMGLIEHDHVVETFSPDRADQPFNIRRLPRGAEGRADLLDAHTLDSLRELCTVDQIAITNEIFGRLIPRGRLSNLLGGPCRRWVLSDVEVNHFALGMAKYDKAVQNAECRRGYGEEVNGYDVLKMIVEEGSPSLRWRLPVADDVLGDRALRNRIAD